jgi:hypothetical protein
MAPNIAPTGKHPMNISPQNDRRERELAAAQRISEALFQHMRVEELVEKGLKIALEVVNGQAGCVLPKANRWSSKM